MSRWATPFLCVSVAALASLGCAGVPVTGRPTSLEELHREEGWTLIESVPFVQQVSEEGCGAACLAMVLGHWGRATPVEDLEAECGISGAGGIRASALRDAAKRRGLSAFLFRGGVPDLEHELSRGRPVLVCVVEPAGDAFTPRFRVVVGFHPGRRRLARLDPTLGLMWDTVADFEDEWLPMRCVTLVVFLPETMWASGDAAGTDTGGGPCAPKASSQPSCLSPEAAPRPVSSTPMRPVQG